MISTTTSKLPELPNLMGRRDGLIMFMSDVRYVLMVSELIKRSNENLGINLERAARAFDTGSHTTNCKHNIRMKANLESKNCK